LFHLADRIEDAKNVFRSRAYYDAETLSKARRTVENALLTVSIAHYPTRLELMSYSMPDYDGTFASIEKLTDKRDENPYLDYFEKSILPYLREQTPDVLGISIAGESQLMPALTLCRLIKTHYKCHIVLGGYIVTLLADSLALNKRLFEQYCDSLMVLEGERPILELVKSLENHENLESVPNLIYFNGSEVQRNPTCPPEPMETLPPPDFDGLPLQQYLAPDPVLPVLASRGCYWGKCAFCSHNVSYENKYRFSPAEKIVGDLEILHQKYGVRHFAFSDEAIAPKVMRELVSTLIKRKSDFRFSTNIRLEPQFTPELCASMHEGGFRVAYLGLESGCDRIIGLMKKGFNTETAVKIFRNLTGAGIWDHLYVFLGFPGESEAEAKETLGFLSLNSSIIRSFNVGSFTLGRGSEVMRHSGEYGVAVKEGQADSLALMYSYDTSQGISNKKAVELSREAWSQLSKEYPTRNVLELLSKEDLLLYLSHFESTDPALGKIERSELKSAMIAKLTLDSQPKLIASITQASLNFNLPDILREIRIRHEKDAQHLPTRVLFNPNTRKMRSLGPNVSELLESLGGGKTIRVIARQLAKKHGAAQEPIEAFCLDALNQLKNEGYIGNNS
jgi:anaerobic magnesium-protoporphyrin IX monomethyl ester cyclase